VPGHRAVVILYIWPTVIVKSPAVLAGRTQEIARNADSVARQSPHKAERSDLLSPHAIGSGEKM
jgi:hypothetical protein